MYTQLQQVPYSLMQGLAAAGKVCRHGGGGGAGYTSDGLSSWSPNGLQLCKVIPGSRCCGRRAAKGIKGIRRNCSSRGAGPWGRGRARQGHQRLCRQPELHLGHGILAVLSTPAQTVHIQLHTLGCRQPVKHLQLLGSPFEYGVPYVFLCDLQSQTACVCGLMLCPDMRLQARPQHVQHCCRQVMLYQLRH